MFKKINTTGIIRRIDELGRIVIPKELRKSLRIKNGDSLEIFTSENDIILKKYSPVESLESLALKFVDIFQQVIKHSVIVTDRDKVIAVAGPLKRNYLDKNVSEFTDRSIERRDSFVERQKKTFSFVEGEEVFGYYSFSSIVHNGDAIGSVIIVSTDIPIAESYEKMAVILASMLSNMLVD